MPSIKKNKIVLIGAGNVATQLGIVLYSAGHNILQVYSHTKKPANTLAKLLRANAVDDLKNINVQADIYIIAIKDDAIATVIKKLNLKNKILVHTSGSTSMDVFKNASANYGVFYPLQTFSKNKKISFDNIPICIEANNNNTFKTLQQVGSSISNTVQKIDSEQRKAIHLGAVFACNFSNHLYVIADRILSENKIPFDILKPLIKETVNKIENNAPAKMQTGPAVRGDKKIMEAHLKMLSGNREYQQLYKLLSKSIIFSGKRNK